MHTRFFRLLTAILVFQLVIPHHVFAQANSSNTSKKPTVVVDGIYVGTDELVHLSNYRSSLLRAFSNQESMNMVDARKVSGWKKKALPTKEKVVHKNYLIRARAFLARGKQNYQELNFESALQELSQARKEFITNLSHLRSNRDLLDAHLFLGMTYIALAQASNDPMEKEKNQSLANTEFERVVMLDPKRELSSSRYSPSVIESYQKAKRRVTSSHRITATITSNIPSAKVYINGKLLGNTPVKTRLIPGEYYVLVEKKGMDSWSQLVSLRNTVEKVSAQLATNVENPEWNAEFQIREGAAQTQVDMSRISELAKATGADFIFLSNLDYVGVRARILGQLYDVRTGEFSQVAIADIGEADLKKSRPIPDFPYAAQDLAAAMGEMVRSDGYLLTSGRPGLGQDVSRISPESPTPIQEHRKPKMKLYKKWWFWAGIAVVAGGAYFGIRELGGTGGNSIVINNEGNF